MERAQFEAMIAESGLCLIGTMYSSHHFLVYLPLQGEYGTRYANGTLAFCNQEFESMTELEAKKHIEQCKVDITKYATKLGDVVQEDGSVKKVQKRKIS